MRSRRFTLPLALAAVALVATLTAACGKKPAAAPDAQPAAQAPATTPAAAPQVARAVLTPKAGTSIAGTVTFTEENGQVRMTVEVTGVERPGKHGFHIHEKGDCSAPDFTSAGGHFNPGGAPHGCPADAVRHAGDFNNVDVAADGSGRLELTSDQITVADGPDSVVGRSVIFHDAEDDCVTQPTGNAGGRLACGVIERVGAS